MCKAAKADLVFMVDGSWSIGDENFNKIINFLYSTVGALNKIGADGDPSKADRSVINSSDALNNYSRLLLRQRVGNMGKELY